ncbi:hypothetical protein EsHS_00000031 [Epichloe bromicola]
MENEWTLCVGTQYNLVIQSPKRYDSHGISAHHYVGELDEKDQKKLKASAQKIPLQRCQEWTVGVLGDLERKGLVATGTTQYWFDQVEPSPYSTDGYHGIPEEAASAMGTMQAPEWIWDEVRGEHRYWDAAAGRWVWASEVGQYHTLILLHGLGSNGKKFGTELLETGLTSSGHRLTELLPGARFVFPTSKRRRSTAFGRSMLTQWFDIVRLADPSYRKERQLDGLAESAREILEIIADELKKVQPQNLIIGGLSQGCAMSLAVLLSLEHSIGGYIGMSGYLTYQDDLESVIKDEVDSDNYFAHPSEPQDPTAEASAVKVQALERDILDLNSLDCPSQEKTAYQTPVFLGHGKADEKVPCALGEGAARVLRDAGYQVEWKCYENQGHWYRIPDEIDDICDFIAFKVGWEVVVKPTT